MEDVYVKEKLENISKMMCDVPNQQYMQIMQEMRKLYIYDWDKHRESVYCRIDKLTETLPKPLREKLREEARNCPKPEKHDDFLWGIAPAGILFSMAGIPFELTFDYFLALIGAVFCSLIAYGFGIFLYYIIPRPSFKINILNTLYKLLAWLAELFFSAYIFNLI